MKVRVEFDTDGASFDDAFDATMGYVVQQIGDKSKVQLGRRRPGAGNCLCAAPEDADVVRDLNGNKIGTIEVVGEP